VDKNTATGQNALYMNTTGSNNTANGLSALFNILTGGGNSAMGSSPCKAIQPAF
jgi:hypothetical protein